MISHIFKGGRGHMHTLKMSIVKKQASVGDTIVFERKDMHFEGIVYLIRENSVLVDISKEAANLLDYETNRTVVAHGNYGVIAEV